MTTIAANLKMMVADSKVTSEDGSPSYAAKKIVRFPHGIVGASGDGGDCMRFLQWAAHSFEQPGPQFVAKEDGFTGLILTAKGLFLFDPTFPFPEKMRRAKFFAIGSGAQAALAAMHLGQSPIQAVRLAAKLDDATGLPIQVLRLKK